MRNRLVIILLAITFLVTVCITFCGCEEDTGTPAELTRFMDAYNKYHSFKFNGAVLVAKDDEILLCEGYGIANEKEDTKNIPQSVFAIGSITKSFTAIAIMQLQEQGLLSVDDPISKYINYTQRDDITIHQLLTHTSGMCLEGVMSGSELTLDNHLEFIDKCGLQFEPGEGQEYSNAGYILLANIIEKVSGEHYNDYLKKHIFAPLDMNSSWGGTDATYADGQSIGYSITKHSPKRMYIYDFSWITGGGNIYSTVLDMYKYSRGMVGETLLSRESLEKIFTPQWGDWNNGYGYGWETTQKYSSKRLSHSGCIGGGGYVSKMIRYPEEGYVLIFLTNNSDTTALDVVSQSFEAILFDEQYVMPQKLKRVNVADKLLKQYAGDYEIVEGVIISITYKQGKLFSIADDGKNYELVPVSKTRFIYEDHQCTTGEFDIADDGTITYTIHSKTNSVMGQKVK